MVNISFNMLEYIVFKHDCHKEGLLHSENYCLNYSKVKLFLIVITGIRFLTEKPGRSLDFQADP